MVAFPVALGVTQVDANPVSSLVTEQLGAPHAERVAPLVVDQTTVAPLTGVTPSEASTCTITGLTVCVPTGVGGFAACTKLSRSVAAAPKVSASVMTEDAPLAGSVTVTVCSPSACG